MNKINLHDKFELIREHWHPKIVAELNGQHVKLAKLLGEFEWHSHEQEDELFMVIQGELLVHFRDQTITLVPGEVLVIPRGVEHKPEAVNEVQLLMFEPTATINTGNVVNEKTVRDLEWI